MKRAGREACPYVASAGSDRSKVLCDKHMKRAPNRWMHCAGCVPKGREPHHPESEFSKCPTSYEQGNTTRKRYNTCLEEKGKEELQERRKRMGQVTKHSASRSARGNPPHRLLISNCPPSYEKGHTSRRHCNTCLEGKDIGQVAAGRGAKKGCIRA